MSRWVTGKALETLLALGGLQVGDEIKLGDRLPNPRMDDVRCSPNWQGVVATVQGLDGHETYPILTDAASTCPEHIIAWRRPAK
jgi:hypothetical protein